MTIKEGNLLLDQSVISDRYGYKRSWYQLVKITDSNKLSFTLAPGAVETSDHVIPATAVFSLAESRMRYTQQFADENGRHIQSFEDTIGAINSMKLQTNNGAVPLEMNTYVQEYNNVARPLKVSQKDLMSFDHTRGFYIDKDSLTTDNLRPQLATWPEDRSEQPNHLFTGALGDGAGAGRVMVNRFPKLPDIIPDSVFEIKQSIRFPGTATLTTTWGPSSKCGYTTIGFPPAAGMVAIVGTMTIRNVALFLAVEKNPMIIAEVNSAVFSAAGLSLMYPSIQTNRKGYDAGTNHIHRTEISKIQGRFCKKIISTAFAAPNTLNNTYDHSNCINTSSSTNAQDSFMLNDIGSKVISYKTFLGVTPIQDQVIVASNLAANRGNTPTDDYVYLQQHFVNSSITTNDIAAYRWCHIDSFDHIYPPSDDLPVDSNNIVAGLDMSLGDQSYSIDAIVNNVALTWFTWTIMMRELKIVGEQVTC